MDDAEQVWHDILEYLQEVKEKSLNPFMVPKTIQEITHEMRGYGHSEKEVTSELIYLVDMRYVVVKNQTVAPLAYGVASLIDTYTFKQPMYRISARGTDYLRGDTRISRHANRETLHFGDISGVVTVVNGDGATITVTQANVEANNILTKIEEIVRKTTEIDKDAKQDYLGDIATIKSQLAKKNPSKTIIQEAWTIMGYLATLEGVSQLVGKLSPLIDNLLT